jgi:hypothetical protein
MAGVRLHPLKLLLSYLHATRSLSMTLYQLIHGAINTYYCSVTHFQKYSFRPPSLCPPQKKHN